MPKSNLIKKIADAGLLGRGCGTFPVAKKWQAVKANRAKEKYVVCNAAESEPGIFKDKFILDNYAHLVIEGITLAMKELGAAKGFIYLNPHYYNSLRQKLITLIGDDRIETFENPTKGYIGGEETAILNVMEGEREEARLRPPFVTEFGLYNAPTLVNNCETFYDIALIAADKYDHERFFCITGDDTPNNVFSFPENISVREALEKSGHWPEFKFFVQLGGSSAGTCLRPDQLQNFQIKPYAGLTIHQLYKDEKKLINHWLDFYALESCGKCVPCREGTYRLRELFQSGDYESELFSDIIFTMQNTTICSLGKMAVNAITSYYANIKKEPLESIKGDIQKCEISSD